MKNLWAPWRIDYILGPKPDECVFCLPAHTGDDEDRLILLRRRHCFVIMNKFPYNNGHLMVTPYRHVQNITALNREELHETMETMQDCVAVIERAFNRPPGMNIGLNIGEAAGAGIREHLHFHIVPRWVGDNSFMAVMAETSVVPEHLRSTYARLKPYFDQL
ncbi:MAG: HIT domain-containing protein [Deltaproteobacteria bacterium]|nr:HIT domain-containing protein [Deltaproteobacteria bacterium]